MNARIGRVIAGAVLAAAGLGRGLAAGDWPMWRCDAGRTAAAAEDLPGELRLLWEREFAKPSPVYPNDPRMCFDRSYEPVAAGPRLFVPSMVTDSVMALDTATGRELWTFFTEGPVRFAPVVWQDKVYFVSDDGFLYCVTAGGGELLWKFSPMGPQRRARKLLGDERLISRWPARGGPVLADGTVYFAAGVWQFEGVAVCAVEAATGKRVWVNTECHFVKDGLLDHGDRRDGGLAPQGYLAVLGDKLIVPCGRALPGVFDRATGRMEPYTSGWGGRVALAKGSWYACGTGRWMFQSGDVYEVHPPGAAGSQAAPDEFEPVEDFARQMQVAPSTVESWIRQFKLQAEERNGRRCLRVRNTGEITYLSWWTATKTRPARPGEQQVLATRTRLEIDPNNGKELWTFREPVLTGEAFYYSAPVTHPLRLIADDNADRAQPRSAQFAAIMACDLKAPPQPAHTVQGGWGQQLVAWQGKRFQELWTLDSPLKVHIKAGRRLYAGAERTIAAVEIPGPGGQPAIAWETRISGTPSRMLAADGKLFVVTLEGRIACFGAATGAEPPGAGERPAVFLRPPSDGPAVTPDSWTGRAAEILRHYGSGEGYAIALGIGSGRLVHELVRQSQLRLIVLESDPKRAATARREFFDRGLYGSRVQVLAGDLDSVRPAPCLAGLVAAEELPPWLAASKEAAARLVDLLHPYGGTACFPAPAGAHDGFARQIAALAPPGIRVERASDLTLLRRPGALPGAADWGHESGDPAHTYASGDRRVTSPLAVLWFGGGLDREVPWVEGDPPCLPGEREPSPYAGGSPRPRVAGGRMFTGIGDELYASDIYTGRFLWRRTIRALGDFAACEDAVYAASEGNCVALDAATGQQRAAFPAPAGGVWRQVRLRGDALVATAGDALVCLERRSGVLRWQHRLERDALRFAVAQDRVFCADFPSLASRRREAPESQRCSIAALSLAGGAVLWRVAAEAPVAPIPGLREFTPPLDPQVSYSAAADVVVFTRNGATAAAYRGADGQLLWSKEVPCKWPEKAFTSYHPPVVLDDRLVTHGREVIALASGQPAASQLWDGARGSPRGCGRALGCSHLLLIRDAHASYYDFEKNSHTYFRGIRSGCTNSLVPADGVLSAPNFSRHCNCNYPVSTSLAFVTIPEAAGWDAKDWTDN